MKQKQLSVNPSDNIDYDCELKPQPLLLNRSRLANTIDQLTPLIDKFKWSTKREEFCAFWNFYAGNSKKLNTTNIPKSILNYLIQDEQCKVQDIDMQDMPTEGAEKIVFDQFMKCFYCAKKPAKEKCPKHSQAWPIYKAALREKKELINSIRKSRNPYEIESLKEKLKLLKQAEKRKYRTLPYPERLYKQRKMYEQVPKTSTESLERRAPAKPKINSPKTSIERLERRAQAKPRRNLPKTSTESLERSAEAMPKRKPQQQTKPHIDGEYPKQGNAWNVKQMEPEQIKVAGLKGSPGILNQRPSRGKERLKGRNRRSSRNLGDSQSSRRRAKHIERWKSIVRKVKAKRKQEISREYPIDQKFSAYKKALGEISERINGSDIQLEIGKITKAEKAIEREEARAEGRPNGSDSSASPRENNKEKARPDGPSESEAKAIEVDKSQKIDSQKSQKDYLSPVSLKKNLKKPERSAAFISFPLSSMKRKVQYDNPYGVRKSVDQFNPSLKSKDVFSKVTKPLPITSGNLIMEMAKDKTNKQPTDMVKARPKHQLENRDKDQLKDNKRYATNLIKNPFSLSLAQSNDLQSRLTKSPAPKAAKDEPINQPNNFSSSKVQPKDLKKKNQAKGTTKERKPVNRLSDGSCLPLSLGSGKGTDVRFAQPRAIPKRNRKVYTLEEKYSPLLLADLIKRNKYLVNTLNEAYSSLHLMIPDASSQAENSIERTSQEVQDSVGEPHAPKCTPGHATPPSKPPRPRLHVRDPTRAQCYRAAQMLRSDFVTQTPTESHRTGSVIRLFNCHNGESVARRPMWSGL